VGIVRASAERTYPAAAPEQVFDLLSDYVDGRPRVQPEAFADWAVEEGGIGEGTVVTYTLHAAKRQRPYRLEVSEPEPGRVLAEDDTTSTFAQTWTVEPVATGGTRVAVACSWQGAGGVGGIFEGIFAPKGVTRLYEQILAGVAEELATGAPEDPEAAAADADGSAGEEGSVGEVDGSADGGSEDSDPPEGDPGA
jgi:hypothetical protein